ncbi:putative deacetylase LmbE-like domain-containing protein [Dipodascopsis tothii]|uniref:putative deacetylase LmbE-like domain-containing protein n=1 Tax=Dipodascopsis tothii TaxID=44089 RepID=UPI0034CD93A0
MAPPRIRVLEAFILAIAVAVALYWQTEPGSGADALAAASRASSELVGRRIVLLIAHPDDEVMFFGPTLQLLGRRELGNELAIVCASTGDADGLGEVRARELVASAAWFGIPAARVTVVDDAALPDAMGTVWAEAELARAVGPLLAGADTVVTFDAGGVSGHSNHRSLFAYATGAHAPPGVAVWTLESVSIVRKYSAFAGLAAARARAAAGAAGQLTAWSAVGEHRLTAAAMRHAHASQMVWFRNAWLELSRYLYINDLRQERGPK